VKLVAVFCLETAALQSVPRYSECFPLGEVEETTGTLPYYVDEDYPAGPGITEPLPERSN